MTRLSIVLLFILAAGPAAGMLDAAPLQLTAKDLPGWEIGAPDTYSAKELYGYINGGAEIYLEYGFRSVLAQRCTRDKHEFQVDIYEMVNSEAAFGMFSTLRGRCGSTLTGTAWHCVTPEQILFAKGKFLVSIVPYDRASDTKNAAMAAAKKLIDRIREAEYKVPAAFRGAPFSTSQKTLRYIHGPLALQSVLSDWQPWLEKIDRYDMHHVTVGDGGRRTEAAVLAFNSKRDAERFLASSGLEKTAVKDGWRNDPARGLALRIKGDRTVHVLWGKQVEALRAAWK